MHLIEVDNQSLLITEPAWRRNRVVLAIAVSADVLVVAEIVLPIDRRQVRPRLYLGEHEKEMGNETKARRVRRRSPLQSAAIDVSSSQASPVADASIDSRQHVSRSRETESAESNEKRSGA